MDASGSQGDMQLVSVSFLRGPKVNRQQALMLYVRDGLPLHGG